MFSNTNLKRLRNGRENLEFLFASTETGSRNSRNVKLFYLIISFPKVLEFLATFISHKISQNKEKKR